MGKKRIIKKYELLTTELIELIKDTYPDGFEDELISIPLPTGELALALPLETEEISYLIKMPNNSLPDDSEDYDRNSNSSSEFDNFESLEAAEDIPDESQ